MSVIDALFHPRMLGAMALFALCVLLFELLALRLADHHSRAIGWLLERIALPAGRALALVIFILAAYPVLYGVPDAPSLSTLLAGGHARLAGAFNLALLVALALPMVPVVGSYLVPVLLLQGIVVSNLVGVWLAHALERPWTPALDLGSALAILLIALLATGLARAFARPLGTLLNRCSNSVGFESLVFDAAVMLLQVPAILLFTLSAGRCLR